MSETNAEKIRRLREVARANGLCSVCRTRPQKPGTVTCQVCLDRTKEKKKSARYIHCMSCWVDVRGTGKVYCDKCGGKRATYQCSIIEDAKHTGRCTRCRKAPAPTGRSQCIECAEATRLRVLAGARIAGRKPTAKCRVCKQLGIASTGHDHRSHDRWMAAREGWRT